MARRGALGVAGVALLSGVVMTLANGDDGNEVVATGRDESATPPSDVVPPDGPPLVRGLPNEAGVSISLEPHPSSAGIVPRSATASVENDGTTSISFGLSATLQQLVGDRWQTVHQLSGTFDPLVEPQIVGPDEALEFVHIGFTVEPGESTDLTYLIPPLQPGTYRFVKDDLRDVATETAMPPAIAEFVVDD